jgi:hypothetical protein
MRITNNILSIPPYISTSWLYVNTLHVEYRTESAYLIVHLKNGLKVEIPQLSDQLIQEIFHMHSKFLEEHINQPTISNDPSNTAVLKDPLLPGSMLNINLEGLNQFNESLQHNWEQKDFPQLPEDFLKRISILSNIMKEEILTSLPHAEPHCNCPYCQVIRAMRAVVPHEEAEEVISDADLRFKDWEVTKEEDQLYIVTNPLNQEEQYRVFLGTPIGCNCGQTKCEHIKAVLRS